MPTYKYQTFNAVISPPYFTADTFALDGSLLGDGPPGDTSTGYTNTSPGGGGCGICALLDFGSVATVTSITSRFIAVSPTSSISEVFYYSTNGTDWTIYNTGDRVSAKYLQVYHFGVFNPGGSLTVTDFRPQTTSPDFSLAANPSSLSITQGGSATTTLTETSANGFSAATTFALASPDPRITATFAPATVTPVAGSTAATTVTLAVPFGFPLGSTSVDVVATGGGLSHFTTVPLTITRGNIMPPPTTYTGVQSKTGIGREVTYGNPVEAQKLIDAKTNDIGIEFNDPDHETLRGITADFESVPGKSDVPGTLKTTATPEGLSRLNSMLLGDPGLNSGALVTLSGATGGTFTISVTTQASTQTTAALAYNVSAAAVQTAIRALSNVGGSLATVTGGAGGPYTINYDTSLGAVTTAANGASLTGTTPAVTPASYNDLVWLDTFNPQIPHSIQQVKGPSFFVYPGCKASDLSISGDKDQNTPAEFDYRVRALNQLQYATEAAIGTDISGFDPLPAFGPSEMQLSIAGSVSQDAKTFTINFSRTMNSRDVLNLNRGPVAHYVGKTVNTGTITMYFSTELEMQRYFGQVDAASIPYGALKKIRTIPLDFLIQGETNASGFQNQFDLYVPKASYKKVGQPVAGPDAIMQQVSWKAYHDTALGSNFRMRVRNQETLTALQTTGTVITTVPLNGVQSLVLP